MDLLTLQQAMQRLSKSDSTIRRMMKRGELPWQEIKGRYYFKESDVNKLLPKQSDTQEALHEIVTRISTIEQEIEALKQQIRQLTSQVQQLSDMEQARAASPPAPRTPSPPPSTRPEQVRPSVAHSTAIPEGSITLRELADELGVNRTTLYEQIRDHGLEHISISLRDLGKAGAGYERYFSPPQAEAVRRWRTTRPTHKRNREPGDD